MSVDFHFCVSDATCKCANDQNKVKWCVLLKGLFCVSRSLDVSSGRWYLVETNYDHWKQPLVIDNRRDPVSLDYACHTYT